MSQYPFYFYDIYPSTKYEEDTSTKYNNLNTTSSSNSIENRSSIITVLFGSCDNTETINLYNGQNSDNNQNCSLFNRITRYCCNCRNKK